MPKAASFESFEKELSRLAGIFERSLAEFKGSGYVEAQLRDDFLNPFFRSLGWNLENSAGLIQTKREVEIESRTEIGGRQKRADYLFRTEGHDQFVCEAKKPADELHSGSAFQAKRYAWNKNLPLAILTNFEEFKIYIVGGRPYLDEPLAGLWKTWHFRELPLVAQEIWNLLARDKTAAGSIDQLIETLPKTPVGKGKARQQWLLKPDPSRALDVEFLNFLDQARRELGFDLIRNNDRADLLEGNKLNEAVQHIMDRILFLRICEARDIDTGVLLESIVQTWERNYHKEDAVRAHQKPLELHEEPPAGFGYAGLRAPRDSLWRAIVRHFRALDRRPPSHVPFFNGNLFKPHFSEELVVGDGWLAGFVADLSDEESPYLFSYMPVEILGTIYERFLGKVVRPQGRGVTIEEKPEVRKAGGVYYTPRYIVEYIVAQTVEKLLHQAKPEATLKLHFLDPACGSGSFLLRVFEVVCEHWQQWLLSTPGERKGKWCWVDESTGDVHLTMALKRRILTSNVFGVDLDPGAVEVTQLSLYLKMLEHENRNTLQRQRELLPDDDDPLLPPLEKNIQCGNSLIASDFSMIPDDLVRVRAFDWNIGFKDIMKSGGFDAVVGNPPYLNIDDTWGKGDIQLEAIKLQYPQIYNDKTDILFYFIAKGYELSRNKVGFIVSRAFLEAFKADKLRGFLASKCAVTRIVDFRNFYVFDGVGITTCVLQLEKEPATRYLEVYKLSQDVLPARSIHELLPKHDVFEHYNIPRTSLSSAVWTFDPPDRAALNAKLDAVGKALGKILQIGQGMQTGCNDVFGERTIAEMRAWKVPEKLFRFRVSNSDIQRYEIRHRGEVLLYVEDSPSFEKLPAGLRKHLEACSAKLKARAAYKRGNCDWWRFTWPLHREYYSRSRLISPFLAAENRFALVEGGEYLSLTDTIVLFDNGQPESLKYLLGLLNSKLLTLRFRSIGKLKGGGIYEYFWNSVSKLPIRRIDFSKSADKPRHDKLVNLVDKLLGLMPRLRQARSESERMTLQNAVTAADRQIDALVYNLYGLTEKEIQLVEGSA